MRIFRLFIWFILSNASKIKSFWFPKFSYSKTPHSNQPHYATSSIVFSTDRSKASVLLHFFSVSMSIIATTMLCLVIVCSFFSFGVPGRLSPFLGNFIYICPQTEHIASRKKTLINLCKGGFTCTTIQSNLNNSNLFGAMEICSRYR